MGGSLSRAAVLDAALDLADRDGLPAVSIRAVARCLGVTPMALYRHVGDKQGLLDGLVERLLEELPVPDPDLPWPERLASFVSSLRAAARRHPETFVLLLRHPVTTPAAVDRRDTLRAALAQAGVPPPLVERVERLLSTFLLGFVVSEAGGRLSGHPREILDADLAWLGDVVLNQLLPR